MTRPIMTSHGGSARFEERDFDDARCRVIAKECLAWVFSQLIGCR